MLGWKRGVRPNLYNCAENILVGAILFLNVSECQVSKSCNSDAYPRPMSHMCFHKDRHGTCDIMVEIRRGALFKFNLSAACVPRSVEKEEELRALTEELGRLKAIQAAAQVRLVAPHLR